MGARPRYTAPTGAEEPEEIDTPEPEQVAEPGPAPIDSSPAPEVARRPLPPHLAAMSPTGGDEFIERQGFDPTALTGRARKVYGQDIKNVESDRKRTAAVGAFNAAEDARVAAATRVASEKQAKKDRNAAREAYFRTNGVRTYIDANGDQQPVLDEEGRPQYTKKTGTTQYDEKTGEAFRVNRDELGTKAREDLDANAPIVSHPDQPNRLFKANKHTGWADLGSIDDNLNSSDPRVAAGAAQAKKERDKYLGKAAVKGFSAAANEVALKHQEGQLAYDQYTQGVAKIDQAIGAAKANPVYNAREGGIGWGAIGSHPTAEALTLQKQVGDLENDRARLRAVQPPDPKLMKEELAKAKVSANAFQALVTKHDGDVNEAAREYRAQLVQYGMNPDEDPALAHLEKTKKEIGMRTFAEESNDETLKQEKAAREHPAFSPLMNQRDALDQEQVRINQKAFGGEDTATEQANLDMKRDAMARDFEATAEAEQTKQAEAQAKQSAAAERDTKLRRFNFLKAEETEGVREAQDRYAKRHAGDPYGPALESLFGPKESQLSYQEEQIRTKGKGKRDEFLAEMEPEERAAFERDAELTDWKTQKADFVKTSDGRVRFSPKVTADPKEFEKAINKAHGAGTLTDEEHERALGEMKTATAEKRAGQISQAKGTNSFKEFAAKPEMRGKSDEDVYAAYEKDFSALTDGMMEYAKGVGEGAYQNFSQAVSGGKLLAIHTLGGDDKAKEKAAGELIDKLLADQEKVSPGDDTRTAASSYRTAGSTSGQFAAQMLPMILAAVATKGRGATAIATGGGIARATNLIGMGLQYGADGYQSVVQSHLAQDGKKKLADYTEQEQEVIHKEAMRAFMNNMPASVTELLPIEKVTGVFGKLGKTRMGRLVDTMLLSPGSEMAQEYISQKVTNAIVGSASSAQAQGEQMKPEDWLGMAAGVLPFSVGSHVMQKRGQNREYKHQGEALEEMKGITAGIPLDAVRDMAVVPSEGAKALGATDTSGLTERVTQIDQQIADKQAQLETVSESQGALLGVDRDERNKLADELLDLHVERLEATREGFQAAELGDAANDIENIGKNPRFANAVNAEGAVKATQAAARGLVKIAQGKPMEALTTEERAAVESPTPDGLPRVEKAKGGLIISQGAIDRLRDIAPAAAKLIRSSEGERRAALAKPAPEAGKAQAAQPAKAQPATMRTRLLARHLQGTGVSQGEAEQYASDFVAQEGVGEYAAQRDEIARRFRERKPADAEAQRHKDFAELSADLVDEALGQLKKAGHKDTPELRGNLHEVAAIMAPEIARHRKAFDEIRYVLESHDSGGVFSHGARKMTVSITDVLGHTEDTKGNYADFKASPELANARIQEEAIHALMRTVVKDAEVASMWKQLPEKVKDLVRETYLDDPAKSPLRDNAVKMGHEYLRMIVQGKLGNQLTEGASTTLLAQIADILKRLLDHLKNLRKELTGAKVSQETIDFIDTATDKVTEAYRKITADEGAAAPYGTEHEQTKPVQPPTEKAGPGEARPGGAEGAPGTRKAGEPEGGGDQQAGGASEVGRERAPGGALVGEEDAGTLEDRPGGAAPERGAAAGRAEPELDTSEFPVVEVPVDEIHLSKDVPNFKEGADPRTGIIPGNELKGERYVRLGKPPIVVWERADGRKEVITGRHRLHKAKRLGEATIPAQIVREADGFTKDQALTFDAESNITDDQGDLKDYAHYFRNYQAGSGGMSEADARARGLLDRAKGRAGWDIGKDASGDTYALFSADKISGEQAVAISKTAPGNDALQRIGAKSALDGRASDFIANMMLAAKNEYGTRSDTLDMFGNNDAALQQAEQQARRASSIQRGIRAKIASAQGAAKRPEMARELGVNVDDPAAVQAKIAELKTELQRWDNWPMHPELVKLTRQEAAETAELKARRTPETKRLRVLQARATQGELKPWEHEELTRLEKKHGQEFMGFFQPERGPADFELETQTASGEGFTPPREQQMALLARRSIAPKEVAGFLSGLVGNPEPLNISGQLNVTGTGLFGTGLGIKRAVMPQVPGRHQPAFMELLRAGGHTVTEGLADSVKLQPSQGEMDGVSIGKFIRSLKPEVMHEKPIMISADGYVMDGHHRWAAWAALAMEGKLGKMPVRVVSMKIEDLLGLAFGFMESVGESARVLGENQVLAARPSPSAKELAQTIPEDTDPLVKERMEEVYATADAVKAKLDAKGEVFAEKYGGKYVAGPIKAPPSILKKLKADAADGGTDYENDPRKLLDVVRSMILVPNLAEARKIADGIRSEYEIAEVKGKKRFKNRFKDTGPDGYRDMLINVVIDGKICELQVQLPELLHAKETPQRVDGFAEPMSGHDLYKLMGDEKAAHREGSPLHRHALAMSRRMYNYALKAAIARNSASSTLKPDLLNLAGMPSSEVPASTGPNSLSLAPTKNPSPGMSTTALPSRSKNSLPPGKEAGIGRVGTGAGSLSFITTNNIREYAGNVQVKDGDFAHPRIWNVFDRAKYDAEAKANRRMVPLDSLISTKNELLDPRFLSGEKSDPREKAFSFMKPLNEGAEGKRRGPLEVYANPDGTFEIIDGNATAQALMLGGWKANVPVKVVAKSPERIEAERSKWWDRIVPPPPGADPVTLAARKSPKLDPNQGGFSFEEKPLSETPAGRTDLFHEPEKPAKPVSAKGAGTHRRPSAKSAPSSGLDDLFSLMAEQRERKRGAGTDEGQGDLFAPPGQPDVAGPNDSDADATGELGLGGRPQDGDAGGGGRGPGTADQGGENAPGGLGGSGPRRVERPSDPELRNYTIEPGREVSPHGLKSKLRANLEAIRLLKQIESEKRPATNAERDTLVKYSGWGALSQAFDDEKAVGYGDMATWEREAARYRGYLERTPESEYYRGEVERAEKAIRELTNWQENWGEFHETLKNSLTPDEYDRAMRSTINAHYTAPAYISAMWDMARHFGFKGGNFLEPGEGTGHFHGLMPEDLRNYTKGYGVELDELTGRIARMLYPEVDHQIRGFQTADIADGSIDLAMSNVPFASIEVADAAMKAAGGPVDNLHDYFFGKTLTKLRPGGIAIFITSAFTLDKANSENRKWLAKHADLVAAFRLPNDAFKATAGTQVVTDIIVLRKKDGAMFPHQNQFAGLEEAMTHDGHPILVNEYFKHHPQNILGNLADDGSMYPRAEGEKKEMTVHSNPYSPADVALQQAIGSLPENIAGDGQGRDVRNNAGDIKMGSIIEKDGLFYFAGKDEPDPALNELDAKGRPKNRARVKSFLAVRDSLNKQYDLELTTGSTPEELEANRAELNRTYDAFKESHGYFHERKNRLLFIGDPDYFRLIGAEIPEKSKGGMAGIVDALVRGKKQEYVKADVFTKSVLTPSVEPTKADTLEDAYGISLGWRGRVDLDFIASLTGQSREEVERGLVAREIVMRDPATGQLQSKEEYASGNVRKKLEIAKAAGPDYERNVKLLEESQPEHVPISEARFKLGATWIPVSVYQDFLENHLGKAGLTLGYHSPPDGGQDHWTVDRITKKTYDRGNEYKKYEVKTEQGNLRVSIQDQLDALLNMRRVTVKDRVEGVTNPVVNEVLTQAAKDAGKQLQEAFVEWVRNHPAHGPAMEEQFNNEVNAFTLRKHDGQHLIFPWASKDFDIFPDKKNTVWRAIQDGFALIAHGVGGGKTIVGTAIALEMRRLGMARKPMIVVHNSTLEQFADTIAKIAPSARVLVGRKDELQGDKRREFLMRVAAGDWDAVVIAHSTFGLIQDEAEYANRHRRQLITEIMASLAESGYTFAQAQAEKKNRSVKERVATIERLEAQIDKALAKEREKDKGLLTFQQLGVDALIVDEVHKFKKLPFATKLDVKGIDQKMSDRGYQMLMRARYIQERMGGRNVFTMTGTPVSNTLGEIWSQVRLVAPHLLKEYKVETFDQFVSKFAEVETTSEADPSGERKMVERLSKVVNLPEWSTFFRMAADVKLGDALVTRGRPGIKGGKSELVAVEKTDGVQSWVNYIRDVLRGFKNLNGRDFADNPSLLAVPVQTYMASRAAAIDIRLVQPRAKDEPGSKVNAMVERAMELYEQTKEYNGTQAIFADTINNVKTSLFGWVVPINQFQVELDPAKGPGTTFNLYEDIREKLVARGVPREQIAVITDKQWDDAKKKQRLGVKLNAGEIRFVIGGTETVGTGMNIQQRMIAAHHLDVPWTPAGLEQRDGRVFRQDNIHGPMGVPIELIRYGMKETLDEALWQKLLTKQRFITLSLAGKFNGRELEEADDILTIAEQQAILGGPYGRELYELEQRQYELTLSQRAHNAMRRSRQNEIEEARKNLDEMTRDDERMREGLEAMNEVAKGISKDGATITLRGRPPFETKVEMTDAVNEKLADKAELALAIGAGDQKTFDDIRVNGSPIKLQPVVEEHDEFNQETQRTERKRGVYFKLVWQKDEKSRPISFGKVTSPATLLARLEELGEMITNFRAERADKSRKLQELTQLEGMGEWQHEAEATRIAARKAEIQALMRGEDKTKAETPTDEVPEVLAARRSAKPDTGTYYFDFKTGETPADRITKNIGMVDALANRWRNIPGADIDDIKQRARQALVRAARGYDASHGDFAPYASTAVRNSLRDYFEKELKYRKNELQTLNAPEEGMEDPEDKIAGVRDESADVGRDIANRDGAEVLAKAIDALPDKLRKIIQGIMQGESMEIIGDRMGIGRSAVSGHAQIAYTRLRQKLGEMGLRGTDDIMALNARKSPARPGAQGFNPYEAIAELQRLAAGEQGGARTIGRPDLALGASEPQVMGVDEFRKGMAQPQNVEQWENDADAMLARDRKGVRKMIIARGTSGATLNPVETMAAKKLVAQEMKRAFTSGDSEVRSDVAFLINAYRETGTTAARELRARFDPDMTPADRHREFLGKVIFTPPPEVQKKIDEAKSPEERKKLIQADQARVTKIEKELAKMGVSLDDIMRGEVSLHLKASKWIENTAQAFAVKEREALRMIQANRSWQDIAKHTGLSEAQIKAVETKMFDAFVKKHLGKFKAGATAANVDLDTTLAARASVSDAEALEEARRAFQSMGFGRGNSQGKKPFDITNPAQVVRVARTAKAIDATFLDKAMEMWINGILSGPQTHIANIAGNAANLVWDMTVQRGLEAMLNAAIFHDPNSAQLGEAAEIARGIIPGMSRGLRLAIQAFSNENDFFRHDVLNEPVKLTRYDKGGGGTGAIKGTTGRVVRLPGRALMFMDSFFKGLVGQMQAGAEAYRIAKAEGLDGAAATARINQLVTMPNSPAWQKAVERATELTFQQDLKTRREGGNPVEAIAAEIERMRSNSKLLALIAPFVRTPYNIFRTGLRKSPLGAVNLVARIAAAGLYRIRDGKPVGESYLPPEAVKHLAEQLLAWTATALMYGAVQGDDDDDDKPLLITGSMPASEVKRGERELQQRAYGGDYTIRIGGRNGTTLHYGRYEPFATVLGTTVDAIRQLKKGTPAADKLDGLFGYFLAQAQSKTFVQGIADFISAMQDPEHKAGQVGKRFLSSLVPNIIRQPLRNVDDYARDTRGGGLPYQALPAEGMAEPKVDVYGKKVEKGGNSVTRLFFTSPTKAYPELENADKLLLKWNQGNPGETWAPEPLRRTIKIGATTREMSPTEYREASEAAGARVRTMLAGRLSPAQVANPSEKDVELVKNAFEAGRHEAREMVKRKVATQTAATATALMKAR